MTMSATEVADRLEIQELIAQFSHGVDTRRWDDVIALFTPDAAMDYTAIGGPASNPKDVMANIQGMLASLQSSQHMVSTTTLKITGDRATGRSIAHVSLVAPTPNGEGNHVFFTGLIYTDEFTRTPDGWRICARRVEEPWFHNLPTG